MPARDISIHPGWLVVTVLAVILIAYYYIDQSQALDPVTLPSNVSETSKGDNGRRYQKTHTEILAQINKKFSVRNYQSQLQRQQLDLQQKYRNADLVERIVLEGELLLQNIKMANFRQTYSDKTSLLIEAYQSLEKNKDFLPSEAINRAQVGLLAGNTDLAYQVFAKIEFKQRNAKERENILRAAEAAYLRGKIAQQQLDFRKAYRHYRKAAMFTPNNIQYLLAAGDIANEIALYNNAINYYEAALHSHQTKSGLSSDQLRKIWMNLGVAWNSKNNSHKAIEYFEKVLASDVKTFGKHHANIVADKSKLAWAWETQGDISNAIGYYQQALQMSEKVMGLTHPTTLSLRDNIAAAKRLLISEQRSKKSKQ